MPAGYDELMKPVIDNVPMLIVVIVLAIPIAILAIRLAEKTLKKRAASLRSIAIHQKNGKRSMKKDKIYCPTFYTPFLEDI
ncbi:MAG: hypothetical protein J6V98_00825 [Bacteroidales bacterium]|nr:hypothetical protein [Bacteroidales bacterium]